MEKNNIKILILEKDPVFRSNLEKICVEFGETQAVSGTEAALHLMTQKSFGLLLLNWQLKQADFRHFLSTMDAFQTYIPWISLFKVPDLRNVIAAMKSGASNILWLSQKKEEMREKINESLNFSKPFVYPRPFLTLLTETLTEKALAQKTSLFLARREFSKIFLQLLLSQKKLKRSELAELMGVSPRTLHRYLSI